ncbi:MAG TPA: GntR family transcriptional regulator [Chthoniobacteraceae bacterium]|nr:GntR family transcriptional regulator [Chthoniobacteraceae bacterium]
MTAEPSSSPIARRPLYRQVMEQITALARQKQPGELLGKEAEFVKRFGVSLVTVRQALGHLERDGVVERQHGLGTFVPEKPLPRRHIGILHEADPTHPDLSPHFPKLAQEIRLALTGLGLPSRAYYGFAQPYTPFAAPLTCEDILTDLRLDRLSGLIVLRNTSRSVWEGIKQINGLPLLDGKLRWDEGWSSKTRFIRQALKHFKARGRRRLAVLAWENPELLFKPFYTELCMLAEEAGIEIDDRLLDLTAEVGPVGMGWERFRDLWRGTPNKPDSLIVLDDMLFGDCQKAILDLKIAVPQQLDIVVSSSDAVRLTPLFPITVSQTSTRRVAEKYALKMQAMLNGVKLAVKSSTAKLIELGSESAPTPERSSKPLSMA